MRRFRVEVGGRVYEVKVEEIEEEVTEPQAREAAREVKAPADPPTEAAPLKAEQKVSAEEAVVAPMPGVILRINVKVGDFVSSGDAIAVLETMKMENKVVAHKPGVVKEIYVSKGQSVDSDTVIAMIE